MTKTNANRLLKDFEIDWWFAPLQTMTEVGPPDLVGRLLILQRQGEFERKLTASEITSATSSDSTLNFEFITPLAEGVNRKTIAKGFLKNSNLYVIWISGLTNVFEGEYSQKLREIQDSFVLLGR